MNNIIAIDKRNTAATNKFKAIFIKSKYPKNIVRRFIRKDNPESVCIHLKRSNLDDKICILSAER
tara:strand:+ start:1061 stop:1255 length:195 start_codon:yes stop_codon:yes gene_type:complete